MVIFYKKWKKYNEIQLTKKQDGREQSKNEKIIPPPSVYIVVVRKIEVINNIHIKLSYCTG